jgi:hypothetical protein
LGIRGDGNEQATLKRGDQDKNGERAAIGGNRPAMNRDRRTSGAI